MAQADYMKAINIVWVVRWLWQALIWLPRTVAERIRVVRLAHEEAVRKRRRWATMRCNRCHGQMPLERHEATSAYLFLPCSTAGIIMVRQPRLVKVGCAAA
jgi:hypothetical protein